MTTSELKELLDYIMQNNSWKEMNYYNCNRKQNKDSPGGSLHNEERKRKAEEGAALYQ